MTDAREIIAQEFMRAHRDTCYPDASAGECEIAASAIVAALTSTGFRILGPDEIDVPTVEKCAEEVELFAAIDPYIPPADAIRALAKEKQG